MPRWAKALLVLLLSALAGVVAVIIFLPLFGMFVWVFGYGMCDANCAKPRGSFLILLADLPPYDYAIAIAVFLSIIGIAWVYWLRISN